MDNNISNVGDMTFEEELIEAVLKNPTLYDKKSRGYRNKAAKVKLWEEIGKKLGKKGSDCQSRWKSLRERYSREVKKNYTPSGSGATYKQNWVHYNRMGFLKDHITPRQTDSNGSESFRTASNPSDTIFLPDKSTNSYLFECEDNWQESLIGPNQNSRKRNTSFNDLCESLETKKILNHSSSINENFMRTIIGLMEDLPVRAQDEARLKILQILTELRAKHLDSDE